MLPEFVEGPIANVFTAFNQDLTLDETGQRAILDALIATEAVSAYFVRSGMGQYYSFAVDDVRRITEVACRHLDGIAPVIVGCSGEWDRRRDRRVDPARFTAEGVALSQYAQECGAAAVVHTLPEAMALEPGLSAHDATLAYLAAIGAATSLPIFLYQPPNTDPDFCVSAETLPAIADVPGVTGIKVSTADAGYILDLIHAVRGKSFAFVVGNETAYYAGLAMGARACIGQGCCINPAIIRAVMTRFDAGDLQGAMDAQRAVNRLCAGTGAAVSFFKRWLAERGYPVHPYHRPVPSDHPYVGSPPPISDAEYAAFKALLEATLDEFAP